MTNSYPYISGARNITKMVDQLRRKFPTTIDSNTIKELGIAPNNETYLINILKFIKVIDKDGKGTDRGKEVFVTHEKEGFQKGFSDLVEEAYSGLFDRHGDDTWKLDIGPLVTFFRQRDQVSERLGKYKARTFKTLATISGRRGMPGTETNKQQSTGNAPRNGGQPEGGNGDNNPFNKDIGLTVRIEISLPSDGTKETYDDIFRSIKENLINDQNL